jgi:hypothetical protein
MVPPYNRSALGESCDPEGPLVGKVGPPSAHEGPLVGKVGVRQVWAASQACVLAGWKAAR